MRKITLFLMSLFLTVGAMAQENPAIVGVLNVPTEKVDLSQGLESGYYLLKQVNNNNSAAGGQGVGWIKAADEAAGASATSKGTGEPQKNGVTYIWYVDVVNAENNLITISTANKVAAWQAPHQHQKNLVAYAERATLKYHTGTVNLTGDATPNAGSCFISNEGTTAFVHFSGDFLGSWTDTNQASMFMVEFYKLSEEDLAYYGQRYDYEHNTSSINRGDRGLTSFTITDGENSLTVSSIQTSAQAPVYVDKSAEKLTTKQGATLKFTEFNYTGSWMHAYAFIDYNKNFEFTLTNNNKGEGEGEIVSYNYYDGNDITGAPANQGSAIGNTYGESKAMPAFTLPKNLPAGEYRVRIKIDWNNLDADYGASDIAGNGGCQCDFTIVVEEAVGNEIAWDALNNAVDEALALFDAVKIGTSVGSYSSSIDGYEAEFNDIMAYKSSITEETPADEIDAKTERVREIIASFSLNMPKAGDYIRIKSIDGWNNDARYLGSINTTVEDRTSRAEFVAEAGANTIFYFDGENLISYASGNYLVNNSSFLGYNGVQADGTVVEFRTSNNTSNRHAYNISFKGDNDATRWLYTNTANYTDAGSSCGTEGGYNFNLEPVTELPVTISAAKYATFFAPVAVEATGVKAYTVAINGEWATLTEIEGGVIPANTGVVLEGDANTYDFAITTTEATATSALLGTAAATYITADAYVLNNGANGVGFYGAILNQNGNTAFLNNANKAYLPATSVASLSASLRFDFDGTTGIEEIEIRNEKEEIYDLTGRRVNEITKAGVYIVNGKKILVK